MKIYKLFIIIALLIWANTAQSQNFPGYPENASEKVKKWAVLFNFDNDGCLPAPAIYNNGQANGGLKPTGSITGKCRDEGQILNANTYARIRTITRNGNTYEMIMYALYFEKDQTSEVLGVFDLGKPSGHRHDWEYGSVWLTNGKLTHATYSAHSKDGKTAPVSALKLKGNHVKMVYHKEESWHTLNVTHAMRFADNGDREWKDGLVGWATPKILEWDRMTAQQRNVLSTNDWGRANAPLIDKNFYGEIGKYLPSGYPSRTEWEKGDTTPTNTSSSSTEAAKLLKSYYYNKINSTHIQLLESKMSTSKVDGSNTSSNKITNGSILLYKTNSGRYGKMEILNYGYNIKFRATTYNANGSVYKTTNALSIRGTWSCDLDKLAETSSGKDFWWEQISETKRYLSPMQGAKFIVQTKPGSSSSSSTVIKHTSNSSNTSGHITTINNPATNNKPDAVLIVTQNYGVYNVHEIGVWYSNGKWHIFNQNKQSMPLNNQFNILVLPKGSKSYVHTTTGGNTSGHITTLNHPSVNGKSNALVFVTQNYGKYNTSVVGVWYNSDRWKIYNEDMKPMPVGTRFNVYVLNEGTVNNGQIRGTAFKHTNQSSGHISWMNNSNAKDKNSQLFITQNWKGTYNPHTIGVWYSNGKWTAYNQDRKTMKNNVRFNVLAVKSSTNTNPSTNISGTWKNTDANTRGVTKFVVTNNCSTIQVYGSCSPTDCDWGKTTLKKSGSSYKAFYDNVGTKSLTLTPQSNGQIKMIYTSTYRDSRPTKTYTYYFKK